MKHINQFRCRMLGVLQHYVGHMLKPWHTQRHPPQKTPKAYVDSRFNERTTCMHPRTQPQFDHAYTHEPAHNFTTCAHTTTQHTRSYLCKAAPQARRAQLYTGATQLMSTFKQMGSLVCHRGRWHYHQCMALYKLGHTRFAPRI
jgi:hypothetical protein